MIQANTIQQQLERVGIKSMIPTDEALRTDLGGMTPRRFKKILLNSTTRELTLKEVRSLTSWLAKLTHQPVAAIDLWAKMEEVPA